MARVSIALTVYNGERYLAAALESLLGQRFKDFEVIISDNASTDGTQAICLHFAAKDDRIRYVRNRVNVGLAGNFNQAFRLSSGEFFKWAAYDDICGPHLLSRCVEVLDHDPGVVLAYPRVAMIDEDGEITKKNDSGPDMSSSDPAVRLSTLMRNPFWGTSMFGVIRSSVLARTGLMRSNAACDHVLLAELCLHGRFVEVPEYDFFNRDHPGRAVTKSSIVRRALYVDPRLPRVAAFLRVIQATAYVQAVRGAPIGPSDRGRCYVAVGGWLSARIAAWALMRQTWLSSSSSGTGPPRRKDR
jgi:glycosyltransferase involved in cell wall biosynthesis